MKIKKLPPNFLGLIFHATIFSCMKPFEDKYYYFDPQPINCYRPSSLSWSHQHIPYEWVASTGGQITY